MRTIEDYKKCSMLYWYPKLQKLGVLTPKTFIVETPHGIAHEWFDNPKEHPEFDEYIKRIKGRARAMGYPVFMRTDQISGKHGWNDTCFVPSEEVLQSRLYHLIEKSICADILGLPVEAIVIREYIEMNSPFKAFNGLPIAKERRYFVLDGKVKCHHAYWVSDAIDNHFYKGTEEPENWKQMLEDINEESDMEIVELVKIAELVGKELDGFWSVDFCQAKDGKWYTIDCALGKMSYHPPCQFKVEEGEKW